MDLNYLFFILNSKCRSWLPRGAMDLNVNMKMLTTETCCWLPRGAMDLNYYGLRRAYGAGVGSLVEPWI